jgi:hypothetical protein
MKPAAIGMRIHSGWGALVVVAGDGPEIDVLDRRRIVLIDAQTPGAKQPYHFAAEMELRGAGQYLRKCAAASESLAVEAIRKVVEEIEERRYVVNGVGMLLAAGRPLPELAAILASHALIHTAEGEFFRQAVARACERLEIPVTGFRERDLDERIGAAFASAGPELRRRIAGLGKSIGAPWTEDQKKAALAASIVLKNRARR